MWDNEVKMSEREGFPLGWALLWLAIAVAWAIART
jgi:hypothetical protein